MNIFLFIIISILIIAVVPSLVIFILCFIIGMIQTIIEKVVKSFSKKSPNLVKNQVMKKCEVRSEAGKILLSRIKRPEDYKLH